MRKREIRAEKTHRNFPVRFFLVLEEVFKSEENGKGRKLKKIEIA